MHCFSINYESYNRPGNNTHVAEGYPQIDSAAGANGGPSFVKYLFPNAISPGGKQFFLHASSFFFW
jgi:hypothetical protein